MDKNETFSVVITSYNYRDFVTESVDSVLSQTRPATQVIVVDDGSTDGSRELLTERYGQHPQVTLVFEENGGQLVAFQRGVARATGSVICFLDADDYWRNDYLDRIGQIYDHRKDVGFVFTDLEVFGESTDVEQFAERDVDLGYTAVVTYLVCRWYGAPTSALSLRASWARRCLDLPTSFNSTWRISADNCLVFGASVLGAKKYFLHTGGSVNYRTHGKNGWWSNRESPENTYLNHFRSQCLVNHYGQQVGMTERSRSFLKKEFMTKIDPSWSEAKRYADLLGKSRRWWAKRMLRAWKLYRQRRTG